MAFTKHYINVVTHKGKFYHRYKDEEGKTKYDIDQNFPLELYVKSRKGGTKALTGEILERKSFKNLFEFQKFYYDESQGDNWKHEVYGMEKPIYQYISKKYPDEITHRNDAINVMYFDIENEIGDSFPTPEKAEYPINAITAITSKGKKVCWTTLPVKENVKGCTIVCENETELLERFVRFISSEGIDVISGWNSIFYDIPYIVNRIIRVLGMDFAQRLSPIYKLLQRQYQDDPKALQKAAEGLVYAKKEANSIGSFEQTYVIKGLIHIDYMELYKKYSRDKLANYRLNTVAHHELKEKKLDYAPYKNLRELYQNDKALFLEYNIKDVELLLKMNEKLKFIELAFVVAYFSKCLASDVFSVTVVWDCFLYNKIKQEGMVIPPKQKAHSKEKYAGAYVREVMKGKHEYVVSFDLTSLYPMVIVQQNISPETFRVAECKNKQELLKTMVGMGNHELIDYARKNNFTICANGSMYAKDKIGVIPSSVNFVFDKRVYYKNESKRLANIQQNVLKEIERRGLQV